MMLLLSWVLLQFLFFEIVAVNTDIDSNINTDINQQQRIQNPRDQIQQHQRQHQHQKQDKKQQEHRIAILIPFLSNAQPVLPSYFPLFLRSVDGLSSLIDFFIFHNGQLAPLIHEYEYVESTSNDNDDKSPPPKMIMGMPIPNNVKFIDLHNMTHFSSHFLQIMNVKKNHNHNINNDGKSNRNNNSGEEEKMKTIHKFYPKFLSYNPYVLIEFKPALGYIFQNYIQDYTHWGYSDLDIVFGDLTSWITKDELNDFDIVTYGFGDQHRVYLRGQFTFHRNDVFDNSKGIHMLWTKCDYLYHFDDRIMKLLKQNKFQLESAEGCYSSVAISSSEEMDLKIKYAVKAWTNPNDDDGMNEFGVSSIFSNHDEEDRKRSTTSKRNILFKKTKSATGKDYLKIIKSASILKASMHQNSTPMQWEIGERISIRSQGEKGRQCMSWAPQQYQQNICMDPNDDVTNRHTVFLIHGKLYKQLYEERTDFLTLQNQSNDGNDVERKKHIVNDIIESSSLFHVQEWKRTYRDSQLLAMKMSKDDIIGWTFYKEGVIPLFHKQQEQHNLSRYHQNGIVEKKNSSSKQHHFPLPSQQFCFQPKKEKDKDNCIWSASWYDNEVHTIYGPDWGFGDNIHNSTDVTLVQTLQIRSSDDYIDEAKIDALLDVIESNISNWKNQPFVIVICIIGRISKGILSKITKRLNESISLNKCTNYLIGLIEKEKVQLDGEEGKHIPISQNALLNMAEAATFTRWTISGLDIERRRMILSKEAVLFAQRAASAYRDQYGHVFIIPEFIVAEDASKLSSSIYDYTSIAELFENKEMERIQPGPHSISHHGNETTSNLMSIQNQIHSLWCDMTKLETTSEVTENLMLDDVTNDMITKINKIKIQLNRMLLDERIEDIRRSSKFVLMIDRYGPRDGMVTPNLIVESDQLCSCMNLLRLAQLSLLDYKIQPLSGAFSLSLPVSLTSSDGSEASNNEEQYCTMNVGILKEERTRLAKMKILQN